MPLVTWEGGGTGCMTMTILDGPPLAVLIRVNEYFYFVVGEYDTDGEEEEELVGATTTGSPLLQKLLKLFIIKHDEFLGKKEA